MLLYICKIKKKGKLNMDIQEALFELSCFLDMVFNSGILSEGEENLISKVEQTINEYINERN